jgi:uncharacterized delta-60 repeat protein
LIIHIFDARSTRLVAYSSRRRLSYVICTEIDDDPVVAPTPGYTRVGYLNLAGLYTVFGGNYDGNPSPTSYFFNGSLDEAFNSSLPDARVSKIAFQNDGRIAVVFREWGTPYRVMRLNSNGTLDTRFDASLADSAYIQALAVQPDGKIILANRSEEWSGPSRVLRLNVDGSLDSTFRTGSVGDAGISSIALQSDGKILLGGDFTSVAGTGYNVGSPNAATGSTPAAAFSRNAVRYARPVGAPGDFSRGTL